MAVTYSNLDQFHETSLSLECFCLPVDCSTVTAVTKFIASAVGKVYKLRLEKLSELGAPYLSGWF